MNIVLQKIKFTQNKTSNKIYTGTILIDVQIVTQDEYFNKFVLSNRFEDK